MTEQMWARTSSLKNTTYHAVTGKTSALCSKAYTLDIGCRTFQQVLDSESCVVCERCRVKLDTEDAAHAAARQRQADTTGIAVLSDGPTRAGEVTAAILAADDATLERIAAEVAAEVADVQASLAVVGHEVDRLEAEVDSLAEDTRAVEASDRAYLAAQRTAAAVAAFRAGRQRAEAELDADAETTTRKRVAYRVCGAQYVTGGADPFGTYCDLSPGHYPATPHEGDDPMGGQERLRWRGGGKVAGDRVPARDVERIPARAPAPGLDAAQRRARYAAQRGALATVTAHLTPRQERRLRHKANKASR